MPEQNINSEQQQKKKPRRLNWFASFRNRKEDQSTFERAFGFLDKVPWEKISIWAIFLFLLWTLRDFFTLILLTFVFAYIANTIVRTVSERLQVDRRSLTFLLYITFLGLFLGPGQWFASRVIEQGEPIARNAASFIRELGEHDRRDRPKKTGEEKQDRKDDQKRQTEERPSEEMDSRPDDSDSTSDRPEPGKSEVDRTSKKGAGIAPAGGREKTESGSGTKKLPPNSTWQIRELKYRISSLNREVSRLKKQLNSVRDGSSQDRYSSRHSVRRAENVPDHIRNFVNKILRKNIGEGWLSWVQERGLYDYFLVEVHHIWKNGIPYITQLANVIFVNTGNFLFTLLLAILFSFFIVFDIPTLKKRLSEFEEGRLRDFYLEIAPSLANFGVVMGRSLQAQAMIAVVNTLLTISGIYLMSITTGVDFTQYLAVLTIIVFVCSFIPVLGVIISTVPIGLIALVQGGIWHLIAVIILILGIHGIETYILNPNIYGVHMRMHPLLVLIVLLVAEHFFGLWGLILGVPVSVYLLDIVIQQTTPEELFYERSS